MRFFTRDVSHRILINSFDAFLTYLPLTVCTQPSILHPWWSMGMAVRPSMSSMAEDDSTVYMPAVLCTKRSRADTSFISMRTLSFSFASARILSSTFRACRPGAGSAAGNSDSSASLMLLRFANGWSVSRTIDKWSSKRMCDSSPIVSLSGL